MPASAESRSHRAGLIGASFGSAAPQLTCAVVRSSITARRSRSPPTSASSRPRPTAAGSTRGTPSTKKASMPARSKAEARCAA
jgi:hypothetical protein